MIKEKYVNFEIAKLLKEKGFDEKVNTFYKTDTEFLKSNLCINYNDDKFRLSDIHNIPENTVSAPTLQMAIDWLLEIHHYYIQVMLDSWACSGHMGYYAVIQRTDNDFEIMLQDVCDKVFYDKPEDVYNDAIKYILENLI